MWLWWYGDVLVRVVRVVVVRWCVLLWLRLSTPPHNHTTPPHHNNHKHLHVTTPRQTPRHHKHHDTTTTDATTPQQQHTHTTPSHPQHNHTIRGWYVRCCLKCLGPRIWKIPNISSVLLVMVPPPKGSKRYIVYLAKLR